jgi:hypothetical protein
MGGARPENNRPDNRVRPRAEALPRVFTRAPES